ncbi:MFS transporter [Nonomuraea recticatena]|uniref:MFS transporter n=1 Tax=Nonomuraea recticatena TaxID=46178 RepID=UPI0036160B31
MPVKVRSSKGVLRLRGVALLALGFLAMGSVFGSMQVGITSYTAQLGVPAVAGPIYATFSGASVLGGLLYGAIRWRVSAPARLAWGLALLAAATSALMFAGSVPLLYGAAGLAGLVIAPVIITGYTIIERLTPAEVRTEAFTWLTGGIGLGLATGASIAGQLVDRFGPSVAFVVPPLMTGLAAVLIVTRLRSLRPLPEPASPSRPWAAADGHACERTSSGITLGTPRRVRKATTASTASSPVVVRAVTWSASTKASLAASITGGGTWSATLSAAPRLSATCGGSPGGSTRLSR